MTANVKSAEEVCREIAADMANDAKEFDGQPFNGRTVAQYFGNQGAAIAALANIVAALIHRTEADKKIIIDWVKCIDCEKPIEEGTLCRDCANDQRQEDWGLRDIPFFDFVDERHD